MDKPQDPEAAETAQITDSPAVDLPRIVRLPVFQDRLELEKRRYKSVTIRTWKRADGNWSIAPWLFAIQKDGEEERRFTGVPNYCESRRIAFGRALARARWLHNGEWSKHYGPSSGPLPGTYVVKPNAKDQSQAENQNQLSKI